MTKRDKTGEPVESEQDELFERGEAEIKEAAELKNKYLEVLTAKLKPSKEKEGLSKIWTQLALWKYIEAFFSVQELQKEKGKIILSVDFNGVKINADVSYSDTLKSTSKIYGEQTTEAKVKFNQFSQVVW
ncbi:hypothetical protein NO1_1825 [Candidatus Termititenax aidoneus]|uniref:Uncharacterized protein n=1 Tax=Termititenax aidoneus TaxID=2218524 RepID=A0A388TF90_TERA1|nr:hypothetical protein NO1_1825 [Candidatus Termititenax aidoneus]